MLKAGHSTVLLEKLTTNQTVETVSVFVQSEDSLTCSKYPDTVPGYISTQTAQLRMVLRSTQYFHRLMNAAAQVLECV